MMRTALFLAGGNAFFAGALLMLTASALALLSSGKVAAVAVRAAILTAALLVALSAAPLPLWLYVVWAAATITALAFVGKGPRRRTRYALIVLAIVSLAAAFSETRYRFPRRVPAADLPHVVVIGDSISAGMNPDFDMWPRLFAAQTGLDVIDLSQPGETLKSALTSLETMPDLPPASTVVVLEIGGNDMLERLAPRDFARDLDRLLAAASAKARKLVLLELPLPPLHNSYGAAQRRLARQYSVTLMPRNRFARVLALPANTIDSLHLSAAGQHAMATEVERMFIFPDS